MDAVIDSKLRVRTVQTKEVHLQKMQDSVKDLARQIEDKLTGLSQLVTGSQSISPPSSGPEIETVERVAIAGAGTILHTPTETVTIFTGSGGAGRNIEIQSVGAHEGQILRIYNATSGLITIKRIAGQVELSGGVNFDMGNTTALSLQFRIRDSDGQAAWIEIARQA
jgi:hypothetical protein